MVYFNHGVKVKLYYCSSHPASVRQCVPVWSCDLRLNKQQIFIILKEQFQQRGLVFFLVSGGEMWIANIQRIRTKRKKKKSLPNTHSQLTTDWKQQTMTSFQLKQIVILVLLVLLIWYSLVHWMCNDIMITIERNN